MYVDSLRLCLYTTTGARCSKSRPAPHCMVLPPGEFNVTILESLLVYSISDSFTTIVVTVFANSKNIIAKKQTQES